MTSDTKANIVDLAIKFDTEELSGAECIEFASLLIKTGLVNSTGTYQRFASEIFDAGYITETGALTDSGLALVESGE